MSGILGRESAPHGPTAPASDFQVFANPVTDQAIQGRGLLVLVTGDVVVVTEKGNTRTITACPTGTMVVCAITSVQSATSATVLVYTD
jgi:hypothetical protein